MAGEIMNENTRLGISIPTYKRPDELRKCIASVQASAEAYGVPIFIVDDAADDTNLPLFAELEAQYPFIHIIRNTHNLGIDRNIQKAANVCTCDYVWLLGEDGRMRPDGVKTLLDCLEGEEAPFVYVNYRAIDNDISFVIKERSLPLSENQRMDAEAFYRHFSWSMGFIGACVIKKAAWHPVDETPYLDSFFAHVGRIMEAIAGQEVLMIAEPLILNRCGSPEAFSWTGDALQVFTGWEKMTRELEKIYSKEAGEDALRNFKIAHGIGSLKFLAYLRAAGVYHSGMRRQLMEPASDSPGYRLGSWLIAMLPCWPWRVVRKLLMAFRKWRAPLTEVAE
jgi:glycosyltransferase involved in cell wall biosynthesis